MARIDTLESHPQHCALAADDELSLDIRKLRFGRKRGAYRIQFKIVG
jgi:hypothetical protein